MPLQFNPGPQTELQLQKNQQQFQQNQGWGQALAGGIEGGINAYQRQQSLGLDKQQVQSQTNFRDLQGEILKRQIQDEYGTGSPSISGVSQTAPQPTLESMLGMPAGSASSQQPQQPQQPQGGMDSPQGGQSPHIQGINDFIAKQRQGGQQPQGGMAMTQGAQQPQPQGQPSMSYADIMNQPGVGPQTRQRQASVLDYQNKQDAAMSEAKTLQKMFPQQYGQVDVNDLAKQAFAAGPGEMTKGMFSVMASQNKMGFEMGKMQFGKEIDAQNKFTEDTKDIRKEGIEIQNSQQQLDLAKDNPIAYNALPIKLARMMVGSSRINVNELNALGGAQDILDKAIQYGNKMKNGTMTPENYNFMKQMVGVLDQANKQALESMAQQHSSQLSQWNKKSPQENYQFLTGNAPQQGSVQGQPPAILGRNKQQGQGGNEVVRMVRGRAAVFDANTKQFLRWQ